MEKNRQHKYRKEGRVMHELIIADSERHMPDYISSIIREVHQELMVTSSIVRGKELLNAILQKRPDLVIMDILLSGMNGLDVIKQTRKLELPTHFIIISAETRFEYIRTALRLGVDDFLVKPLQPLELQKSVSRVLKKMESLPEREDFSVSRMPELSYSRHIEKAKEWIEKHYADPVSLKTVASEIYLHPTYLGFLFKKELGMSFTDYLTQFRIEAAKHFLTDFGYTTAQTAEFVGYRDVKYFCKVFRKKTGLSPASFQKQNREKIIV